MKKYLLGLCLAMFGASLSAQVVEEVVVNQGGVEKLIIEKNDASVVAPGATAYRVFVDMAAGYKWLAVSGVSWQIPNEDMIIESDQPFYNETTFGGEQPVAPSFWGLVPATQFDSYVTRGTIGTGHVGVLKSVNAAGYVPITPATTPIGSLTIQNMAGILNGSDASLRNYNAVWSSPAVPGPDAATNIVYVGQFTTTGELYLDWTISLQNPTQQITRAFDVIYSSVSIEGCMDNTACNYNPAATVDDGSCVFVADPACEECVNPGPTGTVEKIDANNNGIDDCDEVLGCTDANACNYNAAANVDDASCVFVADPNCEKCENGAVVIIDNLGGGANFDQPDGIADCTQSFGCDSGVEPTACNAGTYTTHVASACVFAVAPCEVCEGGKAVPYEDPADADNVPECDEVPGCTIATACNYNSAANVNDGSCAFVTDPICEVCQNPGPAGQVVPRDENNNGVGDCNETFYIINSQSASCLEDEICLPISTLPTYAADSVIGYDIQLAYDTAKVYPTGNIVIYDELINAAWTLSDYHIKKDSAYMDIALYLSAQAPAGTSWNGTGNLVCVEFGKTKNFNSDTDTVEFVANLLIESTIKGYAPKDAIAGTYISVQDSILEGQLKFWDGGIPIVYDENNPNDYLISEVYGSDASCYPVVGPAVTPDLTGTFFYNNGKGDYIHIKRDIKANTSVMPVINGYDAFLTLKVVLNKGFKPNKYQIIAMDVNMDGAVTAGDVSQINQRTVKMIDEFKQAWNYNNAGVKVVNELSKDWLFIDDLTSDTAKVYTASTTYPLDDKNGYSKFRVPQVAHCLKLPERDADNCQINGEKYWGILLGDIDGTYRFIAPDGKLKSASNSTIVLDFNNAVIEGGKLSVPVAFESGIAVNAVDLALQFNSAKLAFNALENAPAQSLANYADDNTLYVTAASLEALNGAEVFTLTFDLNGEISVNDFTPVYGFINGKEVSIKVGNVVSNVEAVTAAVDVEVYPNPASEMVNVVVSENALVQLVDAAGKSVLYESNVNAKTVNEVPVAGLANGVYFIKVTTGNHSVVEKVVVNK